MRQNGHSILLVVCHESFLNDVGCTNFAEVGFNCSNHVLKNADLAIPEVLVSEGTTGDDLAWRE